MALRALWLECFSVADASLTVVLQCVYSCAAGAAGKGTDCWASPLLCVRTAVKVILTDDVTGTGYRGEQVEVAGGFMRNFLFPGKRAIYATDENKMLYESVDRTPERDRAAALRALKSGRQEMSGVSVVLKRSIPTDDAQPDKGITAKDISTHLQKKLQLHITEEEVRMPGGRPIASIGEHKIVVRMNLSEQATAILEEELGRKEFEKQAWVEMAVVVEKIAEGKQEDAEEVQAEDGETGDREDREDDDSSEMSVRTKA